MIADLLSDTDAPSSRQRRRGKSEVESMVAAAGKLLAADEGPRFAVLDTGGYDTHANQGVTTGRLARQLESLGNGLSLIAEAMAPVWDRTIIVTATEFGRTAYANGTGGTDHGTASVSLLLGGAVNGGRILGTWPGLEARHLFEGRDLAATTDMRSLFKCLLRDHCGLGEKALDTTIFPDSGDVPGLDGLVRV